MNVIYFQFKKHPGDLYRDSQVAKLPNPEKEKEEFWVWFLDNFQSDDRIALLNDLYKFLDGDFYDDSDRKKFMKLNGIRSIKQVIRKIELLESDFNAEAFKNFYNLLLNNQIKILKNYGEQ